MFAWVTGIGTLVLEAARTSGHGIALVGESIRAAPCLLTVRRLKDVLDLLYSYILIALPVTALVSS